MKLKELILQSTVGPVQITKEQLKKLFKQNCKNIKTYHDVVYRGAKRNGQYILWNQRATKRTSSVVSSTNVDRFYNVHMSSAAA